jgi:hypothetical protein
MKKTAVLAAAVTLALLAACAKQEPAADAAQQDVEDGADFADASPRPAEPPPPPADPKKLAAGMVSLIADAPECQAWRDQLQAVADGAPATDEPAMIVAKAHDANCSKKARGETP